LLKGKGSTAAPSQGCPVAQPSRSFTALAVRNRRALASGS